MMEEGKKAPAISVEAPVLRGAFLLVFVLGCMGPTPSVGQGVDAGGNTDAGPLTLTEYPRLGSPSDDDAAPSGPGLVLMGGGTDVDEAFIWAQRRIASGAAGGDVVVLRASGADGYTPYLRALAPFHSVQTLKLTPPSTPADFERAAQLVSRAEFVWFAGGDQSIYAQWKGTPLMDAVQQVYARGGVVGGTSAGLAILGEHAFDAIAAGGNSVTTATAVANPMGADLSFTRSLLSFAPLRGVLTDSHFRARDRFGRLVAFAARVQAMETVGPTEVLGVGVDEASALLVDGDGQATLVLQRLGQGGAWLARIGPARTIAAGQALRSGTVLVTRLDTPGAQTFDFNSWCGTGGRYELVIDGNQVPVSAPADAYGAPGVALACPPR